MKRIFTFLTTLLILCGGVKMSAGQVTLWTGEHTFKDNDKTTALALKVEGCDFSGIDKLKVNVASTDDTSLRLTLAAVKPGDMATWTFISDRVADQGEDRELQFDKNAAVVTDLTSGNYVLAFMGGNCTITKIVIEGSGADKISGSTEVDITDGTTPNPKPDPEPGDDKTTKTVWSGSFDPSSWGNKLEIIFEGANFAAGDEITFAVSTSDNAQMQFGYEKEGETDGYKFMMFDGVNNTGISAPSYTLTLDEEWAAALNEGKKFLVKGQNYTLTGITIKTEGAENVTVTEPSKPEPVDPDAGYTVIPLISDKDHTFGDGWLPRFKEILKDKLAEGNKFYEGDRLRINLTVAEGAEIQYGFNDGTENGSHGGYVFKEEDYYKLIGGADHTSVYSSPFELTIDQDMADALNAGAYFVVRGHDITINGVDLVQPEKRRHFVWVPLFVPNEYPTGLDITGKKNFGIADDKENDPELTDWIGTAKVSVDPYNADKHVVEFYHEWFTEPELTYGADGYTERKVQYSDQLGELNTYPLRIKRDNTPNFAMLKVGDLIRITFTAYYGQDEVNSEANLGTYNPEEIEDLNDPYSGYVGITFGPTGNYKDFGRTNDTFVVDYTVGPVMLDYITRYGLTINGRKFYLNSVMAKIYTDNDDTEQTGNRTIEEFVHEVKISPDELQDLDLFHLIKIKLTEGDQYTEKRTSHYDADDVFLGSNTQTWDTPQTLQGDEGKEDVFKVMVRYYDMVKGALGNEELTPIRVHRASYVFEDHFNLDKQEETDPTPSAAPARAPRKTFPNPQIVPVSNDFTIETSTDPASGEHIFGLRVNTPEMLEVVKKNGLELRGQKYFAALDEIDKDLTGVEEIETGDNTIDYNAPYEVYNLQGMRVSDPVKGNIYIVRQNNKVEKVIIR